MWKKVIKLIFGNSQVGPAISLTLYELGTSGLAYSTRYNHYLMILHYPWLGVKSKLFCRVKNVKMWKAHFLELQVQQTISQSLYELETSGLAYSTNYKYLTILH